MKKRILIISLVTAGALAPNAFALKEFKKSFEERYVRPLDKTAQRVFRRANCNVCHVKGEKKAVNNAYGDHLAQRIEGDAKQRLKLAKEAGTRDQELEQILMELAVALEQTESLPAADGDTYGDRIRSGRLPVERPADERSAEGIEDDEVEASVHDEVIETDTPDEAAG